MQLLGLGAELLVVELADDALQAAARLLGLCQSCLRLGEERLQTLFLFLENRQIHALNQPHDLR